VKAEINQVEYKSPVSRSYDRAKFLQDLKSETNEALSNSAI